VLHGLNRTRDKLWITSKIDPKAYCKAEDVMAKALSMVQESLEQLGMPYIDLLLLHEPCDKSGHPHPSDLLAWQALEQAVANGWVRAIGLDKFEPAQIDALSGTKPAVRGETN
jgi:diketogulonate reductase-like aldo/keto reductase